MFLTLSLSPEKRTASFESMMCKFRNSSGIMHSIINWGKNFEKEEIQEYV